MQVISFLRRYIRHRLLWIIASRFCTSAAGLLVGVVVAHTLGPGGLGAYANLLGFAVIVGTFCCLGMETPYNLRAAKRASDPTGLLLLIGFQAIASVPLATAVWFFIKSIYPGIGLNWLFVPAVVCFILYQLTFPVLSGMQRQMTANLSAALFLVIHAAFVFFVARNLANPLTPTVVSYILSLAALYLSAFIGQGKPYLVRPGHTRIPQFLFGEGRPYLLATACGIIRIRGNVVILGWSASSQDIGNYQIMQTFMEALFLISVTTSSYLLSSQSEGAALFKQVYAVGSKSCIITAVAAIFVALVLPCFIPIIYGAGFHKAVVFSPILLTSAIGFSITKSSAAYLAKIGHASLITRLEFATTSLFLISAIPLTSLWGLEGAIYSFTGATWTGAALHLIVTFRQKHNLDRNPVTH